jgi:hypothetical protein
MQARQIALVAASGVAVTGFVAARAAHQTTPPPGEQDVPGRSVGRSALVGAAAIPIGLAYMYPFTNAKGGARQRAIMVAAGGLQFAAMAGIVNHRNHNGANDGAWNSTVGSMLLSGATGAIFGGGGALVARAGPRAVATWAAAGFVGGLPDGGWMQLFNRPGRNGFEDLGAWVRGDVPR